ncbi:MAG TPA: tryptophan--tRNA ligase, partial [Dyella sp.]|nr:tryptophan--tRNA ligase [Dyella sp.]
FAGGAKQLRETILRIVTDSRMPGEPKDPDSSSLFTIFRAFASETESAAFRRALEEGIGWGEAKQVLFERIETDIAPMRERYESLIARPADIEDKLREGARKARAIASPKIAELRDAIGLRHMSLATVATGKSQHTSKAVRAPRFASFRDADGSFRFRLFSSDGEELLLSKPFKDPKEAGAVQKRLKTLGGAAAAVHTLPNSLVLELDGEPVATAPDYPGDMARDDALAYLREALDVLAAQEKGE